MLWIWETCSYSVFIIKYLLSSWGDWGVTSCRCCAAKIPVSGAKVFKGNSWPSYLLALDYRCGGNPITLKECPKKKALKITPLENKNENEDPLKHGCLMYFLQFPWEGTWIQFDFEIAIIGKHGKPAMFLMIVETEKIEGRADSPGTFVEVQREEPPFPSKS